MCLASEGPTHLFELPDMWMKNSLLSLEILIIAVNGKYKNIERKVDESVLIVNCIPK